MMTGELITGPDALDTLRPQLEPLTLGRDRQLVVRSASLRAIEQPAGEPKLVAELEVVELWQVTR